MGSGDANCHFFPSEFLYKLIIDYFCYYLLLLLLGGGSSRDNWRDICYESITGPRNQIRRFWNLFKMSTNSLLVSLSGHGMTWLLWLTWWVA